MVPFRSSAVCCQEFTSKPLVAQFYIIVHVIMYLMGTSRFKHDMGPLSWLNSETVERALTLPLWHTCKVPWVLFHETTVYACTAVAWM